MEDWELCEDAYRGERAVKERKTRYLPATSSMWEDGFPYRNTRGHQNYCAYLERAEWQGHFIHAVDNNLGRLWHEEGTIELPAAMEPLREAATHQGMSLMNLWRNINKQQLQKGRLGLLADMRQGENRDIRVLPRLGLYEAETIINWDEGEIDQVLFDSLNLVVLDESGYVREGVFRHEVERTYRVLMLGSPEENETEGTAMYVAGTFKEDEPFNMAELSAPNYGSRRLQKIPFVFINSKDLVVTPEEPPLLTVARKDLCIYRASADYRQTLHMQGQYTLAIVGEKIQAKAGKKPNVRTGAGALINLTNPNASVEWLGVPDGALTEQRESMENDMRAAEVMSGSLSDPRSKAVESGDTLNTRVAGETANLITVAWAGALGLQKILRDIAEWIGANPAQVVVQPNTNFGNDRLTPDEILKLQGARAAGAPVSRSTIHWNISRSGLTPMKFEEEVAEMDQEEPDLDGTGAEDSDNADSE